MRFVCFFVLVNCIFSCFGYGSHKRGKLPAALTTTPHTNILMRWTQTLNFDKKSHGGKKVCKRSKSVPRIARNKRGHADIKQKFIDTLVGDITELYLFPNDYEFKAVYDCLLNENAQVRCESGQCEKGVGVLTNKLYGEGKENAIWALIRLEEKNFFMATCGEGTYHTLPFIISCFEVFKKLKKVFLGGICGCSSLGINVGELLIPKSYVFISKTSLGDPSDRQKIGQEHSSVRGKTYQCKQSYFYGKDVIKTELRDPSNFISKIESCLGKHNVSVRRGISCSLDSFIDSKGVIDSIRDDFGEVVVLNMEDGQIAAQCDKHSCALYSFRVVSDHAGEVPQEIVNGGKEEACRQLGEIFKILMNFLALEPNNSF